MNEYFILTAETENLKTGDDKIKYYIEPVVGKGIDIIKNTLLEAIDWVESVGGTYYIV